MPILNIALNASEAQVVRAAGVVVLSLHVHPTLWPLHAPHSHYTNDLSLAA